MIAEGAPVTIMRNHDGHPVHGFARHSSSIGWWAAKTPVSAWTGEPGSHPWAKESVDGPIWRLLEALEGICWERGHTDGEALRAAQLLRDSASTL